MRSCNSYQDIKTPEELEEEAIYESQLQDLLDEYDPDMSCTFQQYKSTCIRRLRERRKKWKQQEK
ncbi:MAG: hypothetical protein KBT02_00035 [Treponema sp.]|nr:hypothetical protein [Candidatus Treponema caballi]